MGQSPALSGQPWLHRDVLDHVFEHGPLDQTLRNAALVCREWTGPAQAALYREIFFFPLDNRRRDLLLARTMRSCPHLRLYIRRLSLITLWTHSSCEELCDWISHIPAHSLREFRWTWIRGHILPSILSSPAILATTRVQLCGRIYAAEKLQLILQLPSLEDLSLELTGYELGDIKSLAASRLKHLHVYLSVEYGPIVGKLLSVVGHRLESLQVSRKFCFESEKDEELVSAIETHCCHLKHLSMTAPFKAERPLPIVDRLARRLQSLERLCCSEGTYTSDLFHTLPPNLITLGLFIHGPSLPHESSLLEFLTLVQAGQRRLSTLVITTKDASPYQSITDACYACGVTVHYYAG
ncbi:hypothetical protein K466DRAFT_365949 [Polyporus arcularius HHB13444]|uniref:F-box domain-containing protein n=1 Tax=Polyporus arcularius HHB13444 TaxID=1314778 RepID=A0A5C3PXJ4_9APHY|nr:hypothetical protein K466DRAFT_365949 [Polyporus arcularius HHB13444]